MDSLRRLVFTPLLIGIHAAHLVSLQLSDVTSKASRVVAPTSSRKIAKCPRHVAFSIVTSHGRKTASSRGSASGDHRSILPRTARSRKGKEKAEDVQWTTEEALVLESVRQAVDWALQHGVDEISLWNEDGLLEAVLPGLLAILVPSPPTPPASGTFSPPRYLSHDVTQDSPGASSSTASQSSAEDGPEAMYRQEVRSYTVWPDMEEMLKDAQVGDKLRLKPLSVHVLPTRTSEEMLADMTKDLVERDIPLREITVDLVDEMMRDALHFHTDPELLIVHHIPGASHAIPSEGSGTEAVASWRRRAMMSLCPAQPLELHGYPFWMLRITEIYDSRSTRASCAMEIDCAAEWDQAMRRWLGVEQRLGR